MGDGSQQVLAQADRFPAALLDLSHAPKKNSPKHSNVAESKLPRRKQWKCECGYLNPHDQDDCALCTRADKNHCAICLEHLQGVLDKDSDLTDVARLECQCTFHKDCALQLLHQHHQLICPICKTKVKQEWADSVFAE